MKRYFRTIQSVLDSRWVSFQYAGTPATQKTDRVLQSSKLEDCIYRDLSKDDENLAAIQQEAAPKLHSAGKLQYTCGGIGKDESTAMRAAMKDYPLALLFAGKDGEYLADLKVDIEPASGEAAQFTASGPVCLVKLADGAYTVTVTAPEGAKQSKKVEAGKGSKSLDFRF